MKILVAEDELEILHFYRIVLESLGHQVVTTKDGNACLEAYVSAINNGRFNLVILDYRMPGKNGIEVAREIAAMAPSQALLMATAYSGVLDFKDRPENMTVLPKPFDVDQLITAINASVSANQLAS